MNKQQLKKLYAKNDFIFHSQWFEIFQGFSVEKAGQVIKCLVDYAKDGIKPNDPELVTLTLFLFSHIDVDRERIAEALAPRRRSADTEKTEKKPSNEDKDKKETKSLTVGEMLKRNPVFIKWEQRVKRPDYVVSNLDWRVWRLILGRLDENGMDTYIQDGKEQKCSPQEAFLRIRTGRTISKEDFIANRKKLKEALSPQELTEAEAW